MDERGRGGREGGREGCECIVSLCVCIVVLCLLIFSVYTIHTLPWQQELSMVKHLLLGLQSKSSPSLLPPTLHLHTQPAQGETEVEVAPRPVLFVSGMHLVAWPQITCIYFSTHTPYTQECSTFNLVDTQLCMSGENLETNIHVHIWLCSIVYYMYL